NSSKHLTCTERPYLPCLAAEKVCPQHRTTTPSTKPRQKEKCSLWGLLGGRKIMATEVAVRPPDCP
ncbi:MAG: hypothetical protein ACXW1Q_03285, partial [Halobacteriota archaeon]